MLFPIQKLSVVSISRLIHYDSFQFGNNKPLNTTSTAVTTYLAYLNRLKQLAERKSQGIELYQLISKRLKI